jgi:RHS repeat-associated protein
MQLASSGPIPDGLLATIALRNENSRLGVPSSEAALHLGHDRSNSEIVLGIEDADSATRVRSSDTGKERDQESGNDYFGARYYASSMGRFLIPDWSAKVEPVPYAKMDNPQTLNLYAYLRNNPLAGVDADGHCAQQDEAKCAQITQDIWRKNEDAGTAMNAEAAQQQANGNAVSKPTSFTYNPDKTGFGFGVQVGADGFAGLGPYGATATGSAGAGMFFGGTNPVNVGAFASGGAEASWGSHVAGAPTQLTQPFHFGGGGGVGPGLFITNASKASQLSGPFQIWTASAAAGVVGLTGQFSYGKDSAGHSIWQFSLSWTFGYEAGAYSITTNTRTIGTGTP